MHKQTGRKGGRERAREGKAERQPSGSGKIHMKQVTVKLTFIWRAELKESVRDLVD